MTEGGEESPLSVAAGNTEGDGEAGNEGDIRGWVLLYITFRLGSDSYESDPVESDPKVTGPSFESTLLSSILEKENHPTHNKIIY